MRMLGLITKKVIFLPIGHRYEVYVIYKRFEVKNQKESWNYNLSTFSSRIETNGHKNESRMTMYQQREVTENDDQKNLHFF